MPTLDIRITSMYPPGQQGGTRAYASATIDGCLAVRGIKVVEGGRDGLFVSMPSRKTQDGYKEVCFPVTAEFREQLHSAGYLPAGAHNGTVRCAAADSGRTGPTPAGTADVRYVTSHNQILNLWRKTQ